MTALHMKLRVILFKTEQGNWIAQALEKDIAAQGTTIAFPFQAHVRHNSWALNTK